VVKYFEFFRFHVALKLLDLFLDILVPWVQVEFLSHLQNSYFLVQVVVFQTQADVVCFVIRLEGHTSVDQVVFSVQEPFKSLPANLLLPVNETVFVAMMVEPNLARLAINLDQFLPVVRLLIGFVVLNQFELIREPASDKQFVDSVCVVAADFLCNKPLVVFVQGDALDYAVNLGTFREKVDSAFLVVHSLDAFRDLEVKSVFVNEKLGAPRGRHVEHFFFIRFFFLLVTIASVLGFGIFFRFVFFNHHILPFSSNIVLEVKVDILNVTVRFEVDPEVLMVEDSLNCVVRTFVKLVFAASSGLNKKRLRHFTGAGKNHNPCVDSASAIRVFGVIIGLIIVNQLFFHFSFMRFSFQPGGSLVIKY